jgi:hypothetical protein
MVKKIMLIIGMIIIIVLMIDMITGEHFVLRYVVNLWHWILKAISSYIRNGGKE